ncbi:cell division topological specificity factor MinE [bacterium]|nr:cell division topological specificity factor MinE [bacterium]
MEFLVRLPFLQWLFGSRPKEDSRQAARNRLKSALVGDRCSVAPGLNESIRKEVMDILGRYMEIDPTTLQLRLEPSGEGMRWSADIKVVRVHRQAHLPEQALVDPAQRKKRPKRILRGARWRRSQEDTPSVEEKSA